MAASGGDARATRAAEVPASARARVEAIVDLGALGRNVAELRRRAGGRTLIAVVKADAYGHGARGVALALEAAGVRRLAVATVAEGSELREAGVRAGILLLGGAEDRSEAEAAAALALTPVVQHAGQLAALAAAGRPERPLAVELEIDTGMARMGVPADSAEEVAVAIAAQPALRLEGVYTHLARPEEPDPAPSRIQLDRFAALLAALRARGIAPESAHVASSAMLLGGGAAQCALPDAVNAVRPGISLYGASPAPSLSGPLAPVLTLRGRVANLRRLAAGDAVGYGATWRATRATRIATVAFGYADGVPWALANRGEMTLRGRRVPIVGRVSMDLTTLDAGEGPVEIGDEVIAFGSGGPSVEEVAGWAGTIPWEILVRVARRVPRVLVGSVL